MAQISIDSKVLNEVNDENIIAFLNKIIDDELAKDVDDIDTEFVDECVDALLALELEENNFVALVPLVSSEQFLKRITKNNHSSFKRLNVFARAAIVAAVITGSTLTANAMVQSVTGINYLEQFGEKVQSTLVNWGLLDYEGIEIIEGVDDDDEITTAPLTTTTLPAGESTTAPTTQRQITTVPTTHYEGIEIIEGVDDDDEPQATKPTTRFEGIEVIEGVDDDDEPTTQFEGIEVIEGVDDDDEEPTTQYEGIEVIEGIDDDDEPETTTKPTTQPTTKPAVTSNDSVKPTKPAEKNLVNVSADVTQLKTDYIYGETISYDGLKLFANYDDGTVEDLSLSACTYSKLYNSNETADYTLSIIYKSCKLEISITVRPDEETRGSRICSNDEYDYLLTDSGAYITRYKGSGKSVILDEVDGNEVIALAANVFKGKDVTSVKSDNVKKLCEGTFRECRELESVELPSAGYIGDYAFEGCEKLGKIRVSSSIDYLGEGAYSGTAVEEMALPDGITKVPDHLFNNCSALRAVELPDTVTEVGRYAFADCTELEELIGCENIKKVSDYAFYNDEKVEFDTFPQGLEEVGDSGFYLCQSLDIGAMPTSVKKLGKSSFAYCTKLTSITIPDGMSVIPYEAFRGTGAKSVVIPEGVEVIEDYALRSIKASEIRLPESMKKIGREALNSPMLRKIYFGHEVEEIADDAFYASRSATFYVYEGTVPQQWAIDNNIKYSIIK